MRAASLAASCAEKLGSATGTTGEKSVLLLEGGRGFFAGGLLGGVLPGATSVLAISFFNPFSSLLDLDDFFPLSLSTTGFGFSVSFDFSFGLVSFVVSLDEDFLQEPKVLPTIDPVLGRFC